MLRKWGSVVAAAAMLTTSTMAFAGSNDQQQGALAPGNAAGVEQAEGMGNDTVMLLVGLGVVAGGLCLVLCSNHNGSPSATTTNGM